MEIDGYGLRDRTSGYRDESVSFVEYIGGMAARGPAPGGTSFMGADGTVKTDGLVLTDAGSP